MHHYRKQEQPLAGSSGIAQHPYLFEPGPYSIRDAVYGSVPLGAAAYRTLDTRLMQRLVHIRQVPPAHLVYPGATHTRFSHSIGVYHLVRLALQHLTAVADIDPEAGRATLAAGMLHDLGHFPFSHLMEEIAFNGTRLHHGQLSVSLIEGDAELRRVLADDWGVDVGLVTALLSGADHPRVPPFLHSLVDSHMDMDKLDYLNRDAHHAGVPYGRVEVQRLIASLRVDAASGRLVMAEDGVGTVESVVFAKYLMFRYVYWHHAARIASAMFNRAVADSLRALGFTALSVQDQRLRRLCLATDATLGVTLHDLLQEAGVPPPPSMELMVRSEERRLYKRAVIVPCAAVPQLDAALRDSSYKRACEAAIAERVTAALGAGTEPLRDFDILIDIPPTAKFEVDFAGVILNNGGGIVPWADAPQPSYLSHEAVGAIETSLRFVQVVFNADHDDADQVKAALRGIPDLLSPSTLPPRP